MDNETPLTWWTQSYRSRYDTLTPIPADKNWMANKTWCVRRLSHRIRKSESDIFNVDPFEALSCYGISLSSNTMITSFGSLALGEWIFFDAPMDIVLHNLPGLPQHHSNSRLRPYMGDPASGIHACRTLQQLATPEIYDICGWSCTYDEWAFTRLPMKSGLG